MVSLILFLVKVPVSLTIQSVTSRLLIYFPQVNFIYSSHTFKPLSKRVFPACFISVHFSNTFDLHSLFKWLNI